MGLSIGWTAAVAEPPCRLLIPTKAGALRRFGGERRAVSVQVLGRSRVISRFVSDCPGQSVTLRVAESGSASTSSQTQRACSFQNGQQSEAVTSSLLRHSSRPSRTARAPMQTVSLSSLAPPKARRCIRRYPMRVQVKPALKVKRNLLEKSA